ncbi:MAG: hypothetical protein R8L07_02850 [Alphaproteobacteria bacterium]|nr:hypothetical protein [Alphaproteobacteria bacterium]
MSNSTLPFLFAAQAVFLSFLLIRARRSGALSGRGTFFGFAILAALAGWGVFSGILARDGVYAQDWFLASWPPFWITMPPVLLLSLPLMTGPGRDGMRALIDSVPDYWNTALQCLRICAIGGVMKGLNGDFTLYFALLIGIPDLLFGLSALWMTRRVAQRRVTGPRLAAWHLCGAAVIVPSALILMQMGLPGPVQVFTDAPGMAAIFQFPMALAPTLVVPVFVALNFLIAWRLLERARDGVR